MVNHSMKPRPKNESMPNISEVENANPCAACPPRAPEPLRRYLCKRTDLHGGAMLRRTCSPRDDSRLEHGTEVTGNKTCGIGHSPGAKRWSSNPFSLGSVGFMLRPSSAHDSFFVFGRLVTHVARNQGRICHFGTDITKRTEDYWK